ncbi:MAG: F0F1 ATP synthase subunit A [Candidatus Omnitrophica bacterium]|nr:F0F1 ATP synthase subunit A [Candidatus Omnitrophota bacterium]
MISAFAEEIAKEAVEEGVHHAAEGGGQGVPEVPNLITILNEKWGEVSFIKLLHHWENVVFAGIIILSLIIIAYLAARKKKIIPGRLQSAVEMVVEGLDNFVCGVMGPEGRRYTPFIGTLFIYIFTMNIAGLIPGMKSPTSNINTTAALAICVFLYVQWTGIKELGIAGYFDHLVGQPRNAVGFIISPLMFVIHIVGEFAKPVSLALRLFGNITGEDVLIAVFVGLGIIALSFTKGPVGIPLQIIFYPLILLFSTIQALVFSLLSTIYISLMLPHREAEHH